MLDYMIYTSVKLEQVAPKVFFAFISGFVLNKNMQIKDILWLATICSSKIKFQK